MTPKKIITLTLTMLIVLSSLNAYAGQWDGFFFGVNAGVAQSNAKYETGPGTAGWASWPVEAPGMWANGGREKSSVNPLVGVSAAYNRQIDSFVFGAELGLNALDADFAHDGTYSFVSSARHYTYRQQTRLDGLITLRGRAGVAFGDSLVSVTGGLAASQLKASLGFNDDFPGAGRYTATRTKRDIALGTTVGLAYEHMLPDDFALKAEFTYVDFGKTRFSTPVFAADGSHTGDMGFSSVQHLSIFTVGLEKKF